MHYHTYLHRACSCRWLIAVAALCFALESLFPHAAMADAALGVLPSAYELRQPMKFPQAGPRPARYVRRVLVTAYSSTPDQTDSTPFTTASGTSVRHGVVAANFLAFGTRLRLPSHFGGDVFTVEDRMHERFSDRLDIWMESREAARAWGVRYVNVEVL